MKGHADKKPVNPGRLEWLQEDPPKALASGYWTIRHLARAEKDVARGTLPRAGAVHLDGGQLQDLDSAGAWLLTRLKSTLEARGVDVALDNFAAENQVLLRLAEASDIAEPESEVPGLQNPLERLGRGAEGVIEPLLRFLAFSGEAVSRLFGLAFTNERLRFKQIAGHIYNAGAKALPIAGLLSLLMGVVIAYQGATLLSAYGADIFAVDLVVISMTRELAPLLTAIIVAGRTGSAYTAQIGTMTVTEEINALRTMGIGPIEYLVLPRLLALIIALPLLTVFCDLTGILGGMLLVMTQLDLGFNTFIDRMQYALTFKSFTLGLVKTPVFAIVIALVGCYQGFRVRGGAASVGRHTTKCVVQSLFLVILIDALFSIYFSWLDL